MVVINSRGKISSNPLLSAESKIAIGECGEIEGSIPRFRIRFGSRGETGRPLVAYLVFVRQGEGRNGWKLNGLSQEGILRKGFLSRGKLLRSPLFSSPSTPSSFRLFSQSEQLKRLSIVILNLALPFLHRRYAKRVR